MGVSLSASEEGSGELARGTTYQGGRVSQQPLVSVVMPCLNEEEAIGPCIEKIRRTFAAAAIDGEIVVCDNGSTDASVATAERMGARVVHQPLRGYGNAYLKGFASARGRYLVMGDADDTYDFTMIPQFVDALHTEGHQFVTGSRYLGGGDAHITALHRYFGNPALTRILNLLFSTRYTDVYCGFRAFSRETYEAIRPVSPGMEFNLELAINAGLAGLRVKEIPIVLAPRKGESKLRTFRDGWRSLRMMLLYSPNKLFLAPGATLLVVGLLLHLAVLLGLDPFRWPPGWRRYGSVRDDLQHRRVRDPESWIARQDLLVEPPFRSRQPRTRLLLPALQLETGLLLGAGLIAVGGTILGAILVKWLRSDLLPLPHPEWVSFAATLVIIGCSTLFSSLFISAMSMSRPRDVA